MAFEDQQLLEVAAAVSDGTPVDWDATSGAARSPASRAVLDELALLARIGNVHRSGAGRTAARYRAAQEAMPAVWGTLHVLERVGAGAAGEVFLAYDDQLQRQVALKLLYESIHTEGESPLAEGRLLARVRHPGVVTVFGAAVNDGRAGLWMEFVHGQTLAAILRDLGPFEARDVTHIGVAVAGALSAVHAAGLLHRDIKAQNVMRGDDGRVLLMDFSAGRDQVAAADEVAGTPLYLAPELFDGAPPSVRSDIYSIGVLLHLLLTGTFPVEARTPAELRAAHRRGDRLALDALARGAPPPLRAAISCALAPDPRDRFASADEFRSALEAQDRRPKQLRKWVLTGLLAAAVVVTASVWGSAEHSKTTPSVLKQRKLVLLAAFDNWTGSRSLDGVTEAAIERELESSEFVMPVPQQRVDDALRLMAKPLDTPLEPVIAREVCLRDGAIHAFVTGNIERHGGPYKLTASIIDPTDGTAVKTAAGEAADESSLPAAIHQLANQIRRDLGESDVAIREADQALEKVTSPSLQAIRVFSDGLRAFNLDRDVEAESQFNRALALDPDFASAHIWLAWTRYDMQKPRQEWLSAAQRAMDLAGDTSEHEREWIAGSYYFLKGLDSQAISQYEALLRRYPDDTWALGNLLTLYGDQNDRLDDSLGLEERAADAQPKNFVVQAGAALAFLRTRGFDAARPWIARATQLMPGPNDNPDARTSRLKITLLLLPAHELWTEGRAAQAAHVLDSLAGRPEFTVERQFTLNLLGLMRLALGQLRLAEEAFDGIKDPQLRGVTLAEVALLRDDRAGIVARLGDEPLRDFPAVSLLIRAGQVDRAAQLWSLIRSGDHQGLGDPVWSANEIEEARGNRERIAQALGGPFPWLNRSAASVRTFMYSETLARAAAAIGNRAAAIKVLEGTEPLGPLSYQNTTSADFCWMRNEKLLADLYRDNGQLDKARAIEGELLKRLAVADADYPLLIELKQRVGQ